MLLEGISEGLAAGKRTSECTLPFGIRGAWRNYVLGWALGWISLEAGKLRHYGT